MTLKGVFYIWSLMFLLNVDLSLQDPKDCLIDVVFLIEESSFVSEAEYNLTLKTIIETVKVFDVKENGVNVGVGCYSENFRKIFDMDYYYSKSVVITKISEISHLSNSGPPNIPRALNQTCSSMFSSRAGDRWIAGNFLVVLSSSGDSSGTEEEIKIAKQFCKDNYIRIISLDKESSHKSIMENIAYDSSYHLDFGDKIDIKTVAMEISTIISNNDGCKEAVDRLAEWLEVIIFGILALITFVMCLICFLQNRYLRTQKSSKSEKYVVDNKKETSC